MFEVQDLPVAKLGLLMKGQPFYTTLPSFSSNLGLI